MSKTAIYNCGCINYGNDSCVYCESCGYVSCLDCHHIDSTPANVDDWKCKAGYGCSLKERFMWMRSHGHALDVIVELIYYQAPLKEQDAWLKAVLELGYAQLELEEE